MSEYLPLLNFILNKSRREDGALDIEFALNRINNMIGEFEADRKRTDRANMLMADELGATNMRLRDALADSKVQNIRFQAALDNMQQGLALYDKSGRIVVCNRRFLEIYDIDTSLNPSDLNIEQLLNCSKTLASISEFECRLLIDEQVGLPWFESYTLEQSWPHGRSIKISRTRVEDGGFLDTIDDVTESLRNIAQIEHMAKYDALTNLPNRNFFKDTLEKAINESKVGEKCAVMCIDLDRFKAVNDTLGHPVGDSLLIEVTAQISNLVRKSDIVARLGGDEFAVILQKLKNKQEAEKLAARIIKEISKPHIINGHQIIIGASIGIEFVEGPETSSDEVIRNADLALYKAKNDGRGAFFVFEPELHSKLARRCQLEVELRQALLDNEFEVFYQPQYRSNTGEISGFEALVRWRSPTRGLISPIEFISLAEETGLIDELGAFVLRKSCHDALTWPENLTIAVNVSPIQFKSKKFLETVKEVLSETQLNPSRLEVEITENVMISDSDITLKILHALKKLGVKISLDDFGTGYSSLSYIRNFPFDKIKIDQTFIRDLGDTKESLAIIRAVSGLCGSMGIISIAEGVETKKQFEIIKRENCEMVQGYLFSKPVPWVETDGLIHSPEQRLIA